MAIGTPVSLGTVKESATLTTSGAASAGSRIFLFAFWFDGAGATLTGASGGGLTWVADKNYVNATGNSIAIASADAPSGLAASTVITATFSSAVDFGPGLAAAYATGIATGSSGYVDSESTNKESGADPWTANAVTTVMADTLVWGFAMADVTNQVSGTAPYTELHDWNPEGSNIAATVYAIRSSAGSTTPGGDWNAAGSFGIMFGIAYESGEAAVASALVAAREFNGGRFGPF